MLRNDLYRPWFVGENDWGFEFISGEFKDLSIQLTKLDFSESKSGAVDLEFHIVHKPEYLKDLEPTDSLLNNSIELVINDILKEAIELHEQTRNNGTEKSSS